MLILPWRRSSRCGGQTDWSDWRRKPAVHLTALGEIASDLLPSLGRLAEALETKAAEFADVVKSGRTHLMDAVPVTLGQEFGGYAAQVRQGIARVEGTLERLGQIPLGGTATGTGLNTHPEFAERVRRRLAEETGLSVSAPRDPFEAQAARDALVEVSGALKTVAVSLTKIANDVRLMGSGPRAGLAEIRLPELQKGSSIMPGKVNPVIPEVVTQVSAQVVGNDAAIAVGGMQGHFELNVFIPMMARNLLDSIRLLASASRLFAERVRRRLAGDKGLAVLPPADPFEAQAARDGLVEASGALKTVAVSLTKIANDLRLMGSGPRAGLAEIALPELQKGSSIMPGKVNPVIPEVVTQVAAQVIGNDVAVTVGGMQGQFELNVFVPVIARNVLDSIRLLTAASRLLADKCVAGIEANRENCERYAELTLSAATALNPYIGYDKATEIVKEAAATGKSLREVAREAGVDEATLESALDYRAMASPHLAPTETP